MPAPVAVWLDYLIRFQVQALEDYVGVDRSARAKMAGLKAIQRVFGWTYNRMRAALGDIPHEMPDQYELRRLAAPYFHHRLSGGEGDMLVGKALWTHLNKKAHMICELSPYACMPNTMSIGAMAGVTRHVSRPALRADRGQGRCRGARAVALPDDPHRSQEARVREYVEAMEKTGLTPETARADRSRGPE
jgi:predicted nucleotide-binding protein (sugar kinase/HSP70/actin superfamily)